ncbi:cdp-diacylglycerol-inositol 3-phosphatidyltransferase [Moniliophthora roreri MCA 2997]|uniref:CDP-diacylglycerol--inositol 3-phosphatidyltransferase n=1 Tax=Moniliophthora roreri (strain MCA 2997) TaxID=1381753 RepID=V2XCB8_MONRO|nr:cdp-diacylglycerol-inositol 3-phosphatidyltransferase [Moniliophthora roreri MCA 2997]
MTATTSSQDNSPPEPERRSIGLIDARVAVDLATASSYSENVFLFVPNLIGYTRIILAAVSIHYMSYHPIYCTTAYVISCLLDAADGLAARKLKQSSKFGACLDMVTDRCTTTCLLCYLSIAYPTYAIFFQALITLDFSSHYMHMYSSLLTGSESHKRVTSDVSRILRWYYTKKWVLFLICAANELFFVALYLVKWTSSELSAIPFVGIYVPSVIAQIPIAKFVAWCTLPVCALKNVINLVQLWKASKVIVGVDLAERRAKSE